MRDHQGNDDQVNGQAGRTGHKGRNQNGDEPFFPAVDIARGHHGRDGTGRSRHERHHAFAAQPEGTHQPIHQKDHPAHIARLFEDGDEEKQEGDLGDENHDPADAGDDPLCNEVGENPGGQGVFRPFAGRCKPGVYQIHRKGAPVVDGLEDGQQDHKEDQVPENLVREDLVEARPQPPCGLQVNFIRLPEDVVDLLITQNGLPVLQAFELAPGFDLEPRIAVGQFLLQGGKIHILGDHHPQFVEVFVRESLLQSLKIGRFDTGNVETGGTGQVAVVLDQLFEVVNPGILAGAHQGDAGVEHLLHSRHIEADPLPRHAVGHVDDQNGRDAEVFDLGKEQQVSLQVLHIADHHGHIGEIGGVFIEQQLNRHAFVKGGRVQAVRAGKVQDVGFDPPGKLAKPLLFFDGDAGIVPHLLVQAGQAVKDRGFSRIRVPDERDLDILTHAPALVPILSEGPRLCGWRYATRSR